MSSFFRQTSLCSLTDKKGDLKMVEKRINNGKDTEKLMSLLMVLVLLTVLLGVGFMIWSLFSLSEYSAAITSLLDGSFLN